MRRERSDSRHGGERGDGLARLILRGVLSGTMIAHGVRHGRTLDGTADWFAAIGFRQPRLQARASAVVEIGSGVMIGVGAAVPVSCSAVVGTMTVAYRTVHRPNGYFVVAEGWEYVGFIAAAATALSALSPGAFSVDRLLRVDRAGSPLTRAIATVGLGVAGALVQLRAFWRNPQNIC